MGAVPLARRRRSLTLHRAPSRTHILRPGCMPPRCAGTPASAGSRCSGAHAAREEQRCPQLSTASSTGGA
eukprot:15388530-Heterocapsa_arctica.AAC.1